ncbi:hypothetical protein X777_15626, partial [Ooceraea biroi]
VYTSSILITRGATPSHPFAYRYEDSWAFARTEWGQPCQRHPMKNPSYDRGYCYFSAEKVRERRRVISFEGTDSVCKGIRSSRPSRSFLSIGRFRRVVSKGRPRAECWMPRVEIRAGGMGAVIAREPHSNNRHRRFGGWMREWGRVGGSRVDGSGGSGETGRQRVSFVRPKHTSIDWACPRVEEVSPSSHPLSAFRSRPHPPRGTLFLRPPPPPSSAHSRKRPTRAAHVYMCT